MRIQALDLFRFLAAIAVVLYHYTARADNNYFPTVAHITQFGYLGVPLFFMISGFVISASAERRTATEFLISRMTRLYPAFWIGVTFSSICIFVFEHKIVLPGQYLANLTMLNDYLGIKNVDGVYWTLQAELKFYGCVFLLLFIGIFARYKVWLSLWLVLTIIYHLLHQPFFLPWFITPDYSPYFISGVAFFLIYRQGISSYSLIILAASSSLCALQAHRAYLDFMPLASDFSSYIAVLFVLLFHGLFFLLAIHKLNFKYSPVYEVLGGITYPLYLIHNHLGRGIIDIFDNVGAKIGACLAAMFVATLFSLLIYRYLEKPIAKIFNKFLKLILHNN